jgi:hypothetical protein
MIFGCTSPTTRAESRQALTRHRHGRRVRHSQGRHRYCGHWHLQARPDHEGMAVNLLAGAPADTRAVAHPDCHVRYPRRLRPRHIRAHRERHQAAAREELLAVCGLLPHGCGTVRRAVGAGRGLCDWHRGRRRTLHASNARQKLTRPGRALVHVTVEDLCRHGADPHFRRGLGALRVSAPDSPIADTHANCSVSSSP